MKQNKRTLLITISNLMSVRNYFHTGIADKLSESFNVIYLFENELYNKLKNRGLLPLNNTYTIRSVSISKNKFFQLLYLLFAITYDAISYKSSTSKRIIINQILNKRRKFLTKIISKTNTGKLLFILFKKCFTFFSFRYKEIVPNINSSILVLTLPQSFFDYYIYLMFKNRVNIMVNQIFSWDNVTSRGPVLNFPDYYFVWNKYVKEEVIKHYRFPENKIRLVSVPFYDFIRRYKKENISLPNENKKLTVLYTTGETSFLDYEPALVEEIYYRLNERYNLNFIVRLHPLDKLDNYKSLVHSNVKLIEPTSNLIRMNNRKEYYFTKKDYQSYIDQLNSANLILNIASTVTIDAIILNRIVANINFMPRIYSGQKTITDVYKTDHFSKVVKYHLFPLITNYNELYDLINKIINNTFTYNEVAYNNFIKDFFSIKHNNSSTEKLISSFCKLNH